MKRNLGLRLTQEEYMCLRKQAENLNIKENQYIQMLIDADEAAYERFVTGDFINEINKVGKGINRIAHNHNAGRNSVTDKKRMFQALDKIVSMMGGL